MKIETESYVVEKISKAGKPYKAIELFITKNVKKQVFLSDAEYELIMLNQKTNISPTNTK